MATASRRRATVEILQRRWRVDGDDVTSSGDGGNSPATTARRWRRRHAGDVPNRRSGTVRYRPMIPIDLQGKRGLVMGVANSRSLGWAIADRLHSAGAELAFSYQG